MKSSLHLQQMPGLLFDRQLVKLHRDRASKNYSSSCFLKENVADILHSRLKVFRRNFHYCLDLGSHAGQLTKRLKNVISDTLIAADISECMVSLVDAPLKIVLDEEALPFANGSFDLIVSALSLHWVNDLPGMLSQIYQCLKPNGLFMASMLGEETLKELRDCATTAEMELRQGVSPRICPMLTIKDAGTLLQRAGFILPVVDIDRFQFTYSHPLDLLLDLRKMGETNALYQRSLTPLHRPILARLFELYQERYSNEDGRVKATFDIVTLTGWAPQIFQ